jgi:antitoxin component YwqK of YwqJK toxin-antitoxin module
MNLSTKIENNPFSGASNDAKEIFHVDKNGKKQGESNLYYSKNELWLKCNYKNNLIEGKTEYYWRTKYGGKIDSIVFYKNGMRFGQTKKFINL